MKRRLPPFCLPAGDAKAVAEDKNVLAEKWNSGEIFLAIGLNRKHTTAREQGHFPPTSDSFACNT